MATLTVKNIPQPVVDRLKQQAMLHRRSLTAIELTAASRIASDAERLLAGSEYGNVSGGFRELTLWRASNARPSWR